jgi:hypothetical protein
MSKKKEKRKYPYVDYPPNDEFIIPWSKLDAKQADKDIKEFNAKFPYVIDEMGKKTSE